LFGSKAGILWIRPRRSTLQLYGFWRPAPMPSWASPDSTRARPALFIPHGVGSRLGQEATAKNQLQGPPINVNGFICRHEGRRHAHLAPRAGSTCRGAAPAPGAQASTMPRRLYAERRLLHPAVAQRAAVDRKAWTGTTKPADSEKSLPAPSIPPPRGSGTPLGHA